MCDAAFEAPVGNPEHSNNDNDHVNHEEDLMDLDAAFAVNGIPEASRANSEDESVQGFQSSLNPFITATHDLEFGDEDSSPDAVSENYERLVQKLVAETEDVDPRIATAKMYEDVEEAAIKRTKYVRHLVEETRTEMRRLRSRDPRRKLLEDFYEKTIIPRYVESIRDMHEAFRSHVIIELYREARPFLDTLVEEPAFVKSEHASETRDEEEEPVKDSTNTFRRAASRDISHREATMGNADKKSTLWTYAFRPQAHFDINNIHQLFQQARELIEANFPAATTFAPVSQTNEDGAEVLVEHPAESHGLSNLVALLFYPPTALTASSRLDVPATRAVLYHVQLLVHRNEILPHLQWAFDAVREICRAQLGFGLIMAPRISNRERQSFVSTMLSHDRERALAADPGPLEQWQNFKPSPDEVLLRCGLVQPVGYLAADSKGRALPSAADHYYSEWKEGGLVPMCDDWRTATTEDYFAKWRRKEGGTAPSEQSGDWERLLRQTLTEPSGSDGPLVVPEPLNWFGEGDDEPAPCSSKDL